MKKQNLKTPKVENSMTIVIGGKKTGVTTENKKHINKFIKDRKNRGKDYRVLIIDFEDEYKGIKIDIKDLKLFKNKIAVIGNSTMTIEQRINLVKEVSYNYRNGLLVIDGFNKLFSNKNNYQEITASFCVNRSKALDVLLVFGGSFLNVPIKIWQNASYLRLHNIIENINNKTVQNRLDSPDLYELATIVRNIKLSNTYKFITIDRDNHKIFGCTKSEYLQGVKEFIIGKIQTIKNTKQLEQFNTNYFGLKMFSDLSQIPISNVDREYITN